MSRRLNVQKLEPKAYEALFGLEGYLAQCGLDNKLRELIKIRASQINGCAYCINLHTKEAMKLGETEQRIFLLNAWRETRLFSAEERAVLAMTEEITRIAHGGLSDETYAQAVALFSENQIAQIIVAVAAINAWNRIAVSSGMSV